MEQSGAFERFPVNRLSRKDEYGRPQPGKRGDREAEHPSNAAR
jgi:hypothetical protein